MNLRMGRKVVPNLVVFGHTGSDLRKVRPRCRSHGFTEHIELLLQENVIHYWDIAQELLKRISSFVFLRITYAAVNLAHLRSSNDRSNPETATWAHEFTNISEHAA